MNRSPATSAGFLHAAKKKHRIGRPHETRPNPFAIAHSKKPIVAQGVPLPCPRHRFRGGSKLLTAISASTRPTLYGLRGSGPRKEITKICNHPNKILTTPTGHRLCKQCVRNNARLLLEVIYDQKKRRLILNCLRSKP